MSEERRAGLTRDEINQIAWRDFIVFASTEPDFIDAFNRETGRAYQVRGVRQTDAQLTEDTEAFVRWVTENHWGIEYAPQSYRDAMARAGAA